ncbi:Predicted polyphosphate-or ATP-dependent NAD kinase [Dethiosulfatibacter aminovorans DSM 17477]|uniref:Predicted polyphosphate-or ATP-dependent NAD kinase n=1 Tax=Dethiosulfatibacter aminovorans DSM 17477 TaxID=1121476 RepID=A0A1M6MLH7_9FIRM|nr:ATP-NAD kinase family protein [Dethiosulfatibacter aminovorans]SHJ84256.1 Predicted polyphosphate-or ATP-dependent NAD kinase [Dethiosulfatibacter aminovorans DSM 17477]
MFKVGLIVNPIAGMGGKVGLKGTDGIDILSRAIAMGARKESPHKTVKALEFLKGAEDRINILTCSGEMGQEECIEAGITCTVIENTGKYTTSSDTEKAAVKMLNEGVDLILFSGGDGTARSIYNAVGKKCPVLGIPSGVKIHSAVFAKSPSDAGRLVEEIALKAYIDCSEREVMDIDEEALREDRVAARLYGYMNVPCNKRYVQKLKSGSSIEDSNDLSGISRYVIDNIESDCCYIIGAGTTTRSIFEDLNEDYTLIGVDVVKNGRVIIKDACERDLVQLTSKDRCKIIVSPIGGQGYLFGRGNQQISSEVISNVGKDNIIIIATSEKMLSLFNEPLLVDTGDERTDEYLKGVYKVVVGYDRFYAWKCE